MKRRKRTRTTPDNPATFLERDALIRVVLASSLPERAKVLLVSILMHLHVETGLCNPSIGDLARASHISSRSVKRWLHYLKMSGCIEAKPAKGRNNRYTVVTRAIPMAPVGPRNPNKTKESNSGQSDGTGATTGRHSGQYSGPHTSVQAKRDIRAPEPEGRDIPHYAGVQAAKPNPNGAGTDSASAPDLREAFARFWQAYPRHVGESATRKAFAAAVQKGADPDRIVFGAKLHALEMKRVEREEKFIKHPANWLHDESYNDAAPEGLVINQNGEPIEIEGRTEDDRHMSFSDFARARGRAYGTQH